MLAPRNVRLGVVRLGIARLGIVLAVALATAVSTALPASAHTTKAPTGQTSLAALLAKDGATFDQNWNDFDILEKAVLTVLSAKPTSPVAVLTDGTVPVTAFLPTDRAFRTLAADLTKTKYASESSVFDAVASLGVDTVEAVLLYHVHLGGPITYRQALKANNVDLPTAFGPTVRVKVTHRYAIFLIDRDPNSANPYVVRPNLNKGNLQIGHGINRVLRPLDLPPITAP